MSQYNWTAAFVAYCNNHPAEEISEAFGIPLESLRTKIAQERWQALRAELPLAGSEGVAIVPSVGTPVAPADPFKQSRTPGDQAPALVTQSLPVALQQKLQALMENRQVNLKDADKLRQHAQQLLEKLASPEGLVMEQLYHNRGQVVRTTRAVSPADLVNIATYLRLIQEMTYRALGDNAAAGTKEQDNGRGENRQAPQIIINLPSAIAQPRVNRQLLDAAKQAGAKIIDVAAEVANESHVPPAN